MGTKTISIMDDVYDRLRVLKSPGESFSDELRRITDTKGSIMDFAGLWSDMSEKDAEKLHATMKKLRTGKRFEELKEFIK